MIAISLDVTKLDKGRIKPGKTRRDGSTPKYTDLLLIENKHGEDEWGNAGFCVQGVSKEEREAGVKGNICGNWKHLGGGKPKQAAPRQSEPPAKNNNTENDW